MNKMRDDQEFNINFVKIIEKERCLYDKNMPEYRSKDMHDQIWKKISDEVKESGTLNVASSVNCDKCHIDIGAKLAWRCIRYIFRFSFFGFEFDEIFFSRNFVVAHCKERWRNLRACLTRHLKQQAQANGNPMLHKPYYLADHMEFVLPFTKSRSSIGSGSGTSKETALYVESSPIEVSPVKDVKNISVHLTASDDVEHHSHDRKHFHHNETPTYTISESDDNNQYVTFVQNSNGEITSDPLDESNQLHVDDGAIITTKGHHYATTTSAKSIDIYEPSVKRLRVSHQESDDADLNFFRSLLPDIRTMTASQKRRFKMGIFQLIDNVLKNTDANA